MKRVWMVFAAAAALACGGGDDAPATQTVTAGCQLPVGLCIGRTGPTAQVQAEMELCVAPSTPVASCPTANLLGGCRQVDGAIVEITWFYSPGWTLQGAQSTCTAPDAWVSAP